MTSCVLLGHNNKHKESNNDQDDLKTRNTKRSKEESKVSHHIPLFQ